MVKFIKTNSAVIKNNGNNTEKSILLVLFVINTETETNTSRGIVTYDKTACDVDAVCLFLTD